MFSLTGPVTTMPSAWRGEATNWMPNRPMSKTTVPSTFKSASAGIVTAGADLPELERAAEELAHLLVQRLRELAALVRSARSGPRGLRLASRWSWLKADRPLRAGCRRSRCRKGSGPGRVPEPLPSCDDRRRSGSLDAVAAAVGALRVVEDRQAAEAVGERWRTLAGYAIVRMPCRRRSRMMEIMDCPSAEFKGRGRSTTG